MAGEMAEIEGVVIDVEDGLVSSVRQHLAALGDVKPENYTIFRVPARIRERNKDLYEPQMVSIGPYHYGNPAFKAMQMYKWQCLRDLLARGRRNICVEDCISRLRKLEPRARRCYFEPVELDGDEFVEMLLLDGCFVIKFLMIWLSDNKKDAVCNTAWSLSFIRDDLFLLDNQIPFFIIESLFALLFPTPASDRCGVSALIGLLVLCITQVVASIKRAFALLFPTPASELCAVSALMDFIGTYIPRHSALRDFVVTYLTYYSALTASLVTCKTPDITRDEREELPVEQRKEIHHLLHVYHLCFVSTKIPNSSTAGNSSVAEWLKLICFVPTQNPNSSTAGNSSVAKWAAGSLLPCFCISEEGEKRAPGTIPCATALKEAGVTFTKKKDKKSKNETNSSGSFLDITFRNGILEIPFFKVDDSTRSRFANLVAFEQSMGSAEGRYMTSYAYFMDCIINTAKDVAILQNSGIIENLLASDEDLAIFFNQLCEGKFLDLKEHYLAPLFKEVREYCDLKRHKWRAKLMKDYFSNPWAIFSLVAAIAFLIFTFLQTFFTIFPYYHPRNN